jgi:metal-responsive CopG/Arc/MetJ family transcriptional regulator
MKGNQFSKKSTPISLRIPNDMLKEIDYMVEHEDIDRISWVRRALSTFLKGEKEEMKTSSVEDYIHLRIDEDMLKKTLNFDKIPKDIQEARKEMLIQIKSGDR